MNLLYDFVNNFNVIRYENQVKGSFLFRFFFQLKVLILKTHFYTEAKQHFANENKSKTGEQNQSLS